MTDPNPHLAFVFPGQGSQATGMLDNLAQHYPEIKETFAHASEVLKKDLWALISNEFYVQELNQTQNTQPILLAASVAIWNIWCKQSTTRPAWMAGHSLGEYSAMVCADSLKFEDAIKLVSLRGQLMQQAVPEGLGAMAAILGLEDDQVIALCHQVADNDVVSAVNFNAPGQVVIAGHSDAVKRAMDASKTAGAKRAVLLPVSVPSHCALMQSAAEKLAEALESISLSEPTVCLIHNVDAQSHPSPSSIRIALTEQLYKPVRWVDSIVSMTHQGVTKFVECGAGKVLVGLNKRIAKEAEHLSLYDTETFNHLMEQFNG